MRIIKLGIISIIFFAVFLTLLSLFFPSHIRISKAIDINVGKYDVIDQLGSENRHKWYTNADSISMFGKDGKYNRITEVNTSSDELHDLPMHFVIIDASFPNPKIKEVGWNVFPGKASNSVTVQWYMDFHLRWYPWEKFSGLLLEKRYGPLMEKGLENLKKLLEK